MKTLKSVEVVEFGTLNRHRLKSGLQSGSKPPAKPSPHELNRFLVLAGTWKGFGKTLDGVANEIGKVEYCEGREVRQEDIKPSHEI